MNAADTLSTDDVERLRARHYNAAVTSVRMVHDDLMLLRVRPDWGPLLYQPGQYSVLGMGYWEPRLPDTQAETLAPAERRKLIRRAYSICHPVLGPDGELVAPGRDATVEFFIALVRRTAGAPPALTPRLFLLRPGDRLYLGPQVHGVYTLAPVGPDDDVVYMATGTGEAPHNAMLAALLHRQHRGRIVAAVCVRYRHDLAYLATHELLARRFPQYHYFPLTTREPENLDATRPDYVGKQYLQEFVASGELERRIGGPLAPETSHIFLCGNPDMIGAPHRTYDLERRYPTPGGMVELLERRGWTVDEPHAPGNLHFEKYW